jgi:hypothetical protein
MGWRRDDGTRRCVIRGESEEDRGRRIAQDQSLLLHAPKVWMLKRPFRYSSALWQARFAYRALTDANAETHQTSDELDQRPASKPTNQARPRPCFVYTRPRVFRSIGGKNSCSLVDWLLQANSLRPVFRVFLWYQTYVPWIRDRTYRKILNISSISESPGNNGAFIAISAKMQPTLHMSIAVE